MKILMAHNIHLIPGGEDQSFSQEVELLRTKDNQVFPYIQSNEIIEQYSKLRIGLRTLWSFEDYKAINESIQTNRPDLVHVQNAFPLISPSIFYAAHQAKVPTVMSLRNYRLYCLNAYFFRGNSVCELCIDQPIPLSGIRHKCYRDSLAGSLVSAGVISLHRLLRTYQTRVDMFIALTEFAREKFVAHGIPSHKICVKPNFVYPAPQVGSGQDQSVLYIGRLSPEKGIENLLNAWIEVGDRIKLKIAGSGPLQAEVEAAAARHPNIEYLGQQSMAQVYELMGQAQALIFPSLWYEGMPRTIIESFAKGTPVIASNLGAMATMIDHGRTGLHFRPGDASDLADKITWMLDHPSEWQAMRQSARQEFEAKYTAEENYKQLMSIYQQAQENARRSRK